MPVIKHTPNNNDQVEVRIPDVRTIMERPADAIANGAASVLAKYKIKGGLAETFNLRNLESYSLLKMNDDAYIMSRDSEGLFKSVIKLQKEFKETGKVSFDTREQFAMELIRDVTRHFNPDDISPERVKEMRAEIIQHAQKRMAEARQKATGSPYKIKPN